MRAGSWLRLVPAPAPAGPGLTVTSANSPAADEVSACVGAQVTPPQHVAHVRRPCMQLCMAETWPVHARYMPHCRLHRTRLTQARVRYISTSPAHHRERTTHFIAARLT